MNTTFTAVYKKEGDWYIAYVEELPGANSQGRTLEEARENLKEAVQLILEANRHMADSYSSDDDVIKEALIISR